MRGNRRVVLSGVVGSLLVCLISSGCVSTQVSDLDGFDSIPMSRVVPYPPEEELRERSFEVVVVDPESPALDVPLARDSRRRIVRKLRRLVRDAGATIVGSPGARQDAEDSKSASDSADALDFVVGAVVNGYSDSGTWEPPFRFLWQTPEEVVGKEGTCTNRAEIAFEVEVVEAPERKRRVALYSLMHAREIVTKGLDESCPLSDRAREELYELTLDDALSCLRRPINDVFAPRGHVRAHRVQTDTGRHLYQISIGQKQGLERGSEIEIRREQHASSPAGDAWRTERVIVRGVMTDQLGDIDGWAAVDPSKASEEILEGDVVRRVSVEGLLSSLTGPNCKKILVQR